jgi:hypothetical protein
VFEPRSGYVGFVVDKVALGQFFPQVLRFLMPILIPPTAPHSSSIIPGWYNRPVSGLSLTPPHENKKKLRKGHSVSTAAGSLLLPYRLFQNLKLIPVHQPIKIIGLIFN